MLNVLVLIHYFHEDKLGGFRRVANVLEADEQASEQESASVLQFDQQFRFLIPSHRVDGDWASRSGVWAEVEPLPIPFRWPLKGEFWGWLRYSKEYVRALRSRGHKIDVVYIIAPPAWWSVVGLITAKAYGVPVVVDLGDSADSQASGFFSLLIHRTTEAMLRSQSKAMILASPKLQKKPRERVLLTGVGEEFFQVGRNRLAQKPFSPKEDPLVIYTGTIGPLQNLEAFLKVWRSIVAQLPKARFHLYGLKEDAPGKQLLQRVQQLQFQPGQVEINPRISPTEIAERLAEADWGLVCLDSSPKLDYAVPTKMLEYLAAGLPLFGVGGGQIEAMIQQTQSGVYAHPQEVDVNELVNTLSGERTSSVEAACAYAAAELGKRKYKQTVRRVLRQAASVWSPTVQRGIDWLEREVTISPQELGLPAGANLLAMRHSGKNPRIENAYNWAYPEITAYQVSLLMNLYHVSGNGQFVDQSRSHCHWLAQLQDQETGAIPFVFNLQSKLPQYPSWSFDLGMILRAYDLFLQVESDEKVKESRRLVLKWLLSFQQEDGSFRAAKFLDSTYPSPEKNHYSDGGALHIKLLLGFPERQSEGAEYNTARQKLLDWTKRFQTADGRFPMYPETEIVFNHTHQYALEGLFGEPSFAERWEQGMKWAIELLQKNNGCLPRSIDPAESLPAGDATGQFFRELAFGAFRKSTHREQYKKNAEQLAAKLRTAQLPCGSWGESINYGNKYGAPVWVTQLTLAGFLAHECPSADLQLF